MTNLRKNELVNELIKLKEKDFVPSNEASKNVLSGKSSPPPSMSQKKRRWEDREEAPDIDRVRHDLI